MNARLYDPTIGRFLSADSYIQAPYDTQSYNRYSYVKNNPLRYTDPTGHFFSGVRSWVKKHWRDVVGVTLFGPGALLFTNNSIKNYVATHRWAQMVGGVISGYLGGPLGAAAWSSYSTYTQGGSLSQVLGAGLTTFVTAGITNGIGDGYGHNSSFFTIGDATTIGGQATQVTLGMATKKAIMHGIVRGMVHAGQGGKFGAGFASGFVSSSLSVGNKGYGNIYSRTAIMAVVGGTTSVITGGKFANGAESGAFVHLFNAEQKGLIGGFKEFGKMFGRALKFMAFQGEEYDSLMKSDMPVELKRMLQVSVTVVELGGSKVIVDKELLMGFDMLSGYFSPTIPNSWAGYGGYYFRQYTDAFFVLPAKGESYNINNLSPVILE